MAGDDAVTEATRSRTGLFDGLAGPSWVFGCEQLGGHAWGDVDAGEVRDAIACALSHGVVAFDTADCYGPYLSEQRLGTALAGVRDTVVLCSKFGVRLDDQGRRRNDSSPAWCRQALEGSLRRLGVDAIDLYQMHCHDGVTPLGDTVEALQDLRARGLIRAFGLCSVDGAALAPDVIAACDTLQAELSLLTPQSVARAQRACGVGLHWLAYGVLGQGLLSGRYQRDSRFASGDRRASDRYRNFHGGRFDAALDLVDVLKACAAELGCSAGTLAVAWVRAIHPRVWPIVGIKRRSHVEDALRGVSLQLPPSVAERLRAASSAFGERT